MRYRVAHRRAAAQSGLTQVLGRSNNPLGVVMQTAINKLRTAIPVFLWLVFFLLFSVVLIMTTKFGMAHGGYSLLFIGHIAGGTIFLGLGAFQFLARIRDRFRRFHRVNGRVMIVAALVSIACLYAMLPNSKCNACLPSQITVTTLWLASIIAAWVAIRRGDITAHRIHMARGFVSAAYFLIIRTMDHLIGLERLLPFVKDETAQFANSDWMAWVIPVLLVEAVTRTITGRQRVRAAA